MELIILTIAGFVAGFVDALAGGGGVITFPAFLWIGMPVSEIVGTNKLVSTAGTTIAALTFLKNKSVQKEVVVKALPFTVSGSLFGAYLVLHLSNEFLRPLVSILIIAVAIYCFVKPNIGSKNLFSGLTTRSTLLLQLFALLIGFYDGFFGPGTGIFLTFLFVRLLSCDFLSATANTKILNFTSNVIPLIYFISQGNINYQVGLPMLIANMIGGYLGAQAAILKGSKFIKWIYMIMAILTGIKVILDYL